MTPAITIAAVKLITTPATMYTAPIITTASAATTAKPIAIAASARSNPEYQWSLSSLSSSFSSSTSTGPTTGLVGLRTSAGTGGPLSSVFCSCFGFFGLLGPVTIRSFIGGGVGGGGGSFFF